MELAENGFAWVVGGDWVSGEGADFVCGWEFAGDKGKEMNRTGGRRSPQPPLKRGANREVEVDCLGFEIG